MAGKPGLPRPESVGAGFLLERGGLRDWDEDRETPLCWWSWVEKTELHFTEPGVMGRGRGRNDKLGIRDPPQSPASFSSNVSPLVAFSAVLEAFFFFFFWVFRLAEL